MKLFVFASTGGYGEFVTGIVHNSVEEAFELKHGQVNKSLKDLGWELSDLIYSTEVNELVGLAFEGGGSQG